MREDAYPQAMFLRQEHVQLLKQLSDKEFWDYAAACTQATHVIPDDHEPSDAYLVCDLGGLGCVLTLADLRAGVPSPTCCSLRPDTTGWMPGLAAWSNTILAAVDLRAYLLQRMPASTYSSAMLLVTQCGDLFFGLLTPVIGTMLNLDSVPWQSPAQVETTRNFACPAAIRGISLHPNDMMGMEEMEMALLLDIPVMLSNIMKEIRTTAAYG